MTTAFLGLGRMGVLMAGHVLSAGHDLAVWNRSPGKAASLVERGARETLSVEDAVREVEVVVLMLFGPDSVREVLAEVVAAAPPGALVVDGTTIGPEAAREFASSACASGLRYVDAPVAGSTGPAAITPSPWLTHSFSALPAPTSPTCRTFSGAPQRCSRGRASS